MSEIFGRRKGPAPTILRVRRRSWRETLATTSVAIGCGGRHWTPQGDDLAIVARCLRVELVTELRHGASGKYDKRGRPKEGADLWLAMLAEDHSLDVDAHPVTPEMWRRLGPSEGPRRNSRMLAKEPRPTLVIALPGGPGTKNMVTQARKAGVRVVWPLGQEMGR